ncbi:unnamed protein product [Pylaiella littoralis]
MALARCTGILALLVATARQASGFGLGGIGRAAALARRTTGGHSCCSSGRTGGVFGGPTLITTTTTGGGFTAEAGVGIWGTATGGRIGRGARGGRDVRNGGALMMNRSRKAQAKEQQFTEGMCPSDRDNYAVCAMEDDPTLVEVLTAVKAADERKAENIVAIRVAPLTVITEYMVVLEGNSRPQNQAIAQNIEEKMEEAHQRTPKTQGAPESGWILLDYGDIIVHIMTPKSRAYYDLEAFWSNGALVPLEGVLKPNAPTQQQQQEKAAVVEEVDPFWS